MTEKRIALASTEGVVSVVVPFVNEEPTLVQLAEGIVHTFDSLEQDCEIIFVDDGSTDDGAAVVEALASKYRFIRLIRFTRNFGKAAALSAGFRHARGHLIITMDADLQDDPSEIPRFLDELDKGFDLVSGWKEIRHDPISKRWPSRAFNAMTNKLFGIKLHDINCGFKAYTTKAARSLNLYGELYRFAPALLHSMGFRVGEISVQHHPRKHGTSKYGVSRLVKGLLDLFTVKLLTRYQARPLHFFALLGLPVLALGCLAIFYLSVLWLLGLGPIGNRPLLLIGILMVMTGTQLTVIGLLAEIIQATSISERDKYVIGSSFGFTEPLSEAQDT